MRSERNAVRKIRSPHTIGEEWPGPGSVVFQITFDVALHCTGRPVSTEIPWLPGPRNCGQFCADASGKVVRFRHRPARAEMQNCLGDMSVVAP